MLPCVWLCERIKRVSILRELIAHSLGEEEGKRWIALLVLPIDIVDYQHSELTSGGKGLSVFQERGYNTD